MFDLTLPNFFDKTFTDEECQQILSHIKEHESNQKKQTEISTFFPYEKKQSRFSAYFIDANPQSISLLQKIIGLFYEVNQFYYHFEINDILSTHIRLFNQDDYFDWHHDLGREVFAFRKLGFILQLSPPETYRGGDILFNNASKSSMPKTQGGICIFPSYLLYEIQPIISGEMALLFSWAHGKACFQ